MQRSFVLVAYLATLSGCVTAKVERDSEIAPQPVWEATLAPAAGHAVHGTVTLLPLSDGLDVAPRSRVTVTIEGATPGVSLAWHIHRGTCGSDGPIVGPASSYTPVPIGSGGAARLMAEMPVVLRQGGSYFAHVHDAGAMGVEACGALRQVGASVLTAR